MNPSVGFEAQHHRSTTPFEGLKSAINISNLQTYTCSETDNVCLHCHFHTQESPHLSPISTIVPTRFPNI